MKPPEPITTTTTAGARVRIVASERADTVVLANASGGIEIGIGGGTAAWVDAESTKGAVRDSLPAQDDPAEFADQVKVHARTRLDDIVIHRSDTPPEEPCQSRDRAVAGGTKKVVT